MNKDFTPIKTYDNSWTGFGDFISDKISKTFDLSFNWVNDSTQSRYVNIDTLREIMLKENPDLDIKELDDGFRLEAERLNAIQQNQSRGFNLIDINPGLLSNQEFPLAIPYEFLFDGSGFMPQSSGSIAANFRTINIPLQGNFVKIEFIYENNSSANINDTNAKPLANIKYQQALKNTSIVNGQVIYSEIDLTTGYTRYDFDNFARNKVYLGFEDVSQKPHLITKSGDTFNTYFNSLTITLNIGAPKIRITVGFNSSKVDGPSDAAINAQLELMGSARLFKEIDSPLVPFNIQQADIQTPYDPTAFNLFSTTALNLAILNIASNRGYNIAGGPISLGYSVLWITSLEFSASRLTSGTGYMQFNLFTAPAGIGPSAQDAFRVYGAKITLNNGASIENRTLNITLPKPIRVVIPNQHSLRLGIYYQSGVALTMAYSYAISGYAFGMINKTNFGGFYDLSTSKFITDSTFLTDYNRIDAIRDN